MPQHDMNIANGSGASVRADITSCWSRHQNALPNIVNKSTRTNSPITAANWKLTATPVAVG